eukprot:PhM_4_TR8394/c2_g1_i2/m.62436
MPESSLASVFDEQQHDNICPVTVMTSSGGQSADPLIGTSTATGSPKKESGKGKRKGKDSHNNSRTSTNNTHRAAAARPNARPVDPKRTAAREADRSVERER